MSGDADHEVGQYWEEVDKIVGGIIDDIRSGNLTCQNGCRLRLYETVAQSGYIHNIDLAIHALRWSRHSCAGITSAAPVVCDKSNRVSFPFGYFALLAMRSDCVELLQEESFFVALPRGDEIISQQRQPLLSKNPCNEVPFLDDLSCSHAKSYTVAGLGDSCLWYCPSCAKFFDHNPCDTWHDTGYGEDA